MICDRMEHLDNVSKEKIQMAKNQIDGSSSAVDSFLKQRYVTSSDLLVKFNPERLKAKGAGNGAFGADPAATGPHYVFITTPDLNLEGDKAAKVLGVGTPSAPSELAKVLSGGTGFVKLLTNLADGFPAQDVVLDTHAVGEGWEGSKMTMPRHTLNSRQDGTFQLEYHEMAGMPVLLIHKLWVDYIDAVTKGTLSPKTGAIDYIKARILDYAVSIYCFHLLPDAQTIEFAVRYTGCFPSAVPYSSVAARSGPSEGIRLTVPYAFSYMEPLDAAIFNEFNQVAAGTGVSVSEQGVAGATRRARYLKFDDSLPSIRSLGGW